jgi:hypothetical protein
MASALNTPWVPPQRELFLLEPLAADLISANPIFADLADVTGPIDA